jgi:hypothetical protein
MDIAKDTTYRIAIRFPWGELRAFECADVWRDDCGAVRWRADTSSGLDPYLDCALQETAGWVMGWLGGTSDTVVVISIDPDAPTP